MSKFTAPLDLRILQREHHGLALFKILSNFTYHIGAENSGHEITVPEDFETDLATIPRLLRWMVSPAGLHAKAAVVHDFLYAGNPITRQGDLYWPSRKEADSIFMEAMTVLKVPLRRRLMMHMAVRVFGASNFSTNRERTER